MAHLYSWSIKDGGFSIAMLVYQRVCDLNIFESWSIGFRGRFQRDPLAQGPLNLAPFGVAAMSFFWSHLEWEICGKPWMFDMFDPNLESSGDYLWIFPSILELSYPDSVTLGKHTLNVFECHQPGLSPHPRSSKIHLCWGKDMRARRWTWAALLLLAMLFWGAQRISQRDPRDKLLPAEAGKTYVVARDWGNPWDALISHDEPW